MRKWQGSLSILDEIVFFLFEEDFPVALVFDIGLNLYMIWFHLLILILILFLFSYYLYNIIWTNEYFYNSQYLWKLFRENQELEADQWNWMKDKATIDILDHYTKQLSNIEFVASHDSLIKSQNAYVELSNQFLLFNKQKEDLLKVFSLESFNKNKDFKEKKSDKKEFFNQIKKFTLLISDLAKIKSEMGIKFSSDLIKDITNSLSFDYNRYVTDPYYTYFYQILLEDSLRLNIFISRGVRRDKYINQIYYQEEETYPELLDMEQEEASLLLEHNGILI